MASFMHSLNAPVTEKPSVGRPILRWAGSKRALLTQIRRYMPNNFGRYFEPFVGSGCLFFSLDTPPQKAMLGDINAELIETYQTLSMRPAVLHEMVSGLPTDDDGYYLLRNLEPQKLSKLERAARFIYLNRYAFNGVYRVNKKGMFNVPRGRNTGELPSVDRFKFCATRLKKAELKATDFEDVLTRATHGDFVYLDPPYAKAGQPKHGEYGYNAFSEKDISRFLAAVNVASRNGAKILISYALAGGIRNQLPAWHSHRVLVRRHVAGFSMHRRRVAEVLLTNFEPESQRK